MDKKLTELTVQAFIDTLKSDAPAPGGGSASALIAAMGMGLGMMTAELTVGKEKYQAFAPVAEAALAQGLPLTDELTCAVDRDTEAFCRVMSALALPKATEEEKTVRKAAVQEANIGATEVPYQLMERCLSAISVLETLEGSINPNCFSDLGVGALCVKTAAEGAWLNVCINLPGIRDEAFVKEHREKGRALLAEIERRADAVYARVRQSLED